MLDIVCTGLDLPGGAPPAVIGNEDPRMAFVNHSVTKAGLAPHLTRREIDLPWLSASQAGRRMRTDGGRSR